VPLSEITLIKGLIKEEKEKGTTSFLTTHNMYIADELCDRVAFMIDGEIKLIDTPKNLKQKYGQKLIEIEYVKEGKPIKETLKTVDEIDRNKIATIVKSYEIQTMHSQEATLEEIFIQVTGRGLL
jgi:fluoroquinolone transport system ATP-binding protein